MYTVRDIWEIKINLPGTHFFAIDVWTCYNELKLLVSKSGTWEIIPKPQSTAEDLNEMSVENLVKNIVVYTANVPGTRANKSQLRKSILIMVKQIAIETASTTKPTQRLATFLHCSAP